MLVHTIFINEEPQFFFFYVFWMFYSQQIEQSRKAETEMGFTNYMHLYRWILIKM